MLLNIAMNLLFFSDILAFTVERHQEPGEIRLEDSLTRTLRDLKEEEGDVSLVGRFPVEPIGILDEGVTRSIILSSTKKSAYDNAFNDPEWKKQWYMHDYRTSLGPVMDLNLVPVYRMGIAGKGIYVAIVDEAVDMDHPDLQQNLVKELSYIAQNDKIETAKPKTVATNHFTDLISHHGTKSAGVVGMTANNSICGVGMAFDAKIITINRDGKSHVNLINARALSYARDKVDIYSNSWGPADTGSYMEDTEKLTAKAIDDGIKHGRGGLGAIYTFPSGNGHQLYGDNCAADDLVNHVATIGITGASAEGKRSEHSECCAAIYATTFAGYGKSNSFVTTTSAGGQCVNSYTGTSAATPQASSIIALVLQANKKLTYRDVMHLITMGAEVAPLADNDSWYKNGAGFWVSNEFGFGLMNALNMVNWARKWTNVPEKTVCKFELEIEKNTIFRVDEPAKIKQRTNGCQSSASLQERVFYLEQVMLTASIKHRYRGAISITLTSPAGTVTKILTPRKKDLNHDGLRNWNLKSVHNWGEDPNGEWQIKVNAHHNIEGQGKTWENLYQFLMKPFLCGMPDYSETGRVVAMTLWFHGTRVEPDHHAKGKVPRKYSAFRTARLQSTEYLRLQENVG